MKRYFILYVFGWFVLISNAQQGVYNSAEVHDALDWPKYHRYLKCDRAPDAKPISANNDADANTWLKDRWVARPSFVLKKAVVAYDKEAMALQDQYFIKLDKIRERLSMAVAESLRLGLVMTGVEKICAQESALMKSRAWKLLKERGVKHSKAKEEIDLKLKKLREDSDGLFAVIMPAVNQEFAAWVAANPAAGQTLINNRRIKNAEEKAAIAQMRAADAEFQARMAEEDAAQARNAAASAAFEAAEANRRANDAQLRLNAAGSW